MMKVPARVLVTSRRGARQEGRWRSYSVASSVNRVKTPAEDRLVADSGIFAKTQDVVWMMHAEHNM